MNLFKRAFIFKALLFMAIPASAQYYGGGSAVRAHGHSAVGDGGVITNLSILGVMFPKQYRDTLFTATVATANYNIAWSSGTQCDLYLSSNTTLTFSGALAGERIDFFITQSSNTKTITWPGYVKWPYQLAPVLSTTNAATDILTVVLKGTTYYGSYGNFGY